MKPNPMSSKIAAAIIIATAGAALSIAPAHAAEEALPTQIVQTINKYDVSSFQAPVFESPKVVSWAVAYTPNLTAKAELDPAEKALLAEGAELAQKQKTVVENAAAVKRAELQRIVAAKAAAEKAEAERVAAVQAAEKAAADAAAAEAATKAEAERVAAEKVEAAKVTAATKAATAAKTAAQGKSATVSAQSVAAGSSTGSNGSNDSNPTGTTPPSSAIGAALVASAYSQLGVRQDCTAMVEKALRSVGKSVGDIGPNGFYRYGTVVTDPQPGDLMIKSGHVAIYVGNGMAISGGFNNFNTELHPVSYIAGSTYVRVS